MKWLFLVHQVHTRNSKERVKVWRAIKKSGALLYRNSVYVLPYSTERLEDFQWVCQQINDSKGEASVFVSNVEDEKEQKTLESLFRKSRTADYVALETTAQRLHKRIALSKRKKRLTEQLQKTLIKESLQLREAFQDLRKVDFFSDFPPKHIVELLASIAQQVSSFEKERKTVPIKKYSAREFQRKIWTTREHIHIDRLCSAWLIRRFIDPAAKFVFASENSLPKNAIPFDVFGAEFSHHGEDCTFETLMKAFNIRDPALRQIAEIIHDVDLKDHKFGRPESSGIDVLIRALANNLEDDSRLLETGSTILDALYQHYSTKKRRK